MPKWTPRFLIRRTAQAEAHSWSQTISLFTSKLLGCPKGRQGEGCSCHTQLALVSKGQIHGLFHQTTHIGSPKQPSSWGSISVKYGWVFQNHQTSGSKKPPTWPTLLTAMLIRVSGTAKAAPNRSSTVEPKSQRKRWGRIVWSAVVLFGGGQKTNFLKPYTVYNKKWRSCFMFFLSICSDAPGTCFWFIAITWTADWSLQTVAESKPEGWPWSRRILQRPTGSLLRFALAALADPWRAESSRQRQQQQWEWE